MNQLQGTAPPTREFGTVEDDRIVYDHLRDVVATTQHGTIFSVRDFDDDPLGILQIDRAFFQAHADQEKTRKTISDYVPFLIEQESFIALASAMEEVENTPKVSGHLAHGGSIAYISNHISYADLPIYAAARAVRNPELTTRQTTIVHRLIGVFVLAGMGPVAENGILHVSNCLQSFPSSESGRVQSLEIMKRALANAKVFDAFSTLLKEGAHCFFDAASGTQDKFSHGIGKLVMARVSKGSAGLIYKPNEAGENRLLHIPVFLDCDPFATDGSLAPHLSPFTVLEPRFAATENQVHDMMHEIAQAGNKVKRPGTPAVMYANAA